MRSSAIYVLIQGIRSALYGTDFRGTKVSNITITTTKEEITKADELHPGFIHAKGKGAVKSRHVSYQGLEFTIKIAR